jgi:hypothetical protein
MRLTQGKLLKQLDWKEWQESEYLQLDQYYDQGMFDTVVSRLVMYRTKVLKYHTMVLLAHLTKVRR